MVETPDLASYDFICISSSAGKDSQVTTDKVYHLCKELGIEDRIIMVHADLGRMDWPGTVDLFKEHCAHYGFRYEIVSRKGTVNQKGEVLGDILEHVEKRQMWPSSCARFCTSDHKRDQIRKIYVRLQKENGGGPCRILNCMGLRAEESPSRAKRKPFTHNKRASSSTRHVDDWLPVHDWTEKQVWDRIHSIETNHHWAYDVGMPRLSCCFCIFAPKDALLIAGVHNEELLDQHVEVEQKIQHRFRKELSIEEVRDLIRSGAADHIDKGCLHGCWNM